jgi:Spy/CpxP family protein refolding chaperone
MNRTPLLAFAASLLIAMPAAAQQTAETPSPTSSSNAAQQPQMSNADAHLRILSEKLDLSVSQQSKLRPILQNMLDERQRLMHDQTLSAEQRSEKERVLHEKADREARKFLSQEQKKKLDELEAEHNKGESPTLMQR